MAATSKGRRAARLFGILVLVAGIAGAIVLLVTASQRPERAVDRFARGPIGCTVTLEFASTGTYYVFEERLPAGDPVFDDCAPEANGSAGFTADLFDGERSVALRDDESVSYETDRASGTSIGRFDIDAPGQYELVVGGSDPATVAAVGRDPETGVVALRRGALIVALCGVVLGGLLFLAGRRGRAAPADAVTTDVTEVTDVTDRAGAPTGAPERAPSPSETFGPPGTWPPRAPTIESPAPPVPSPAPLAPPTFAPPPAAPVVPPPPPAAPSPIGGQPNPLAAPVPPPPSVPSAPAPEAQPGSLAPPETAPAAEPWAAPAEDRGAGRGERPLPPPPA